MSFVAEQLGISVGILLALVIWEVIWKLVALWKSARKGSLAWFIVLAVFNTAGILPILYIYVFSKMRKKNSSGKAKKKRKR